MRIDFHGLVFETPRITIHLSSPWRATALEHRLFDAVREAIGEEPESDGDELRLQIRDARQWRASQQALVRVLKGWQEEADAGRERRTWRWLMEGDCDVNGYDSFGEPLSLWIYVRVGLDHGGPGEPERGEDIEMEGIGIRVWGGSSSA